MAKSRRPCDSVPAPLNNTVKNLAVIGVVSIKHWIYGLAALVFPFNGLRSALSFVDFQLNVSVSVFYVEDNGEWGRAQFYFPWVKIPITNFKNVVLITKSMWGLTGNSTLSMKSMQNNTDCYTIYCVYIQCIGPPLILCWLLVIFLSNQ